MANGRCRMHGGASLSGKAHGRYKHGRHTKSAKAERQQQRQLYAEALAFVNTLPKPSRPQRASVKLAERRAEQRAKRERRDAQADVLRDQLRAFSLTKGIDLDALRKE